ncbi:MAG: bifunctional nicotinamidase/pyrazinamidase [bacterium]|nr:bifunctional nicotinamidase/pyrazinamidase [bacterium]
MTEETRKALLVVDVQNDFCPGGALPAPDGNQVIKPLNKVIAYFHKNRWPVFLSRDWHPEETKHFEKFGGPWRPHCIQNTRGADFHPDLQFGSGLSYIISKGMDPNVIDSYSPFKGTAHGCMLDELLRSHWINELYIGGLATDYCVKEAVLDACKLRYNTYLLTDTCRAVNLKPGDDVRALSEMANAGAQFITTSEVILQSR